MNTPLLSVIFKKIIAYTVFFFLVLYKQNVIAQIKFSAISSGNQVGKNEYLQIQYTVENAASVSNITPPPFKNFIVVSGPNQQSGMSSINGVTKQYVSIGYVLKPLSSGTFVIPAGKAQADGKNFQSNTLQVTVSNSSSGNSSGGSSLPSPFSNSLPSPFANIIPDDPFEHQAHEYDDYILRKGENVQDKISKNLFVKVDVTKTSCYVGEPIVATYKLYTRLKSESNLTKSPSFNGFSVTDLEKPDNYSLHTEKLNGREYNVYMLRKVQLYPLQPGTVELDPAEVDNKITFIKSEYADAKKGDIFYDMLRDFADAATPPGGVEEQSVTLQSKPLSIEVKALPEENKPGNFKGAVGNFKIEAVAEKTNITTDDVDNLKIVISGTGNIQMVNAPEIIWPDGIEGFESKSSEKIDNISVPIKGFKVFTYPFTALKKSSYNIPSVNFSYFDISSKTYKSISTKAIAINVKSGSKRRMNIFKQVSNILPESFTDRVYKIRWFLIPSALIISGLLFWFIKRGRQDKLSSSVKDSNENDKKNIDSKEIIISEDPLNEPRKKLEESDSKLFYNSLDHSLRKYLSEKLEFPEEDLSRKKINELLDKSNVGIGTTLMLNSLLENIEMNLYAPFSSSNQMQEALSKASEVIALLDKQMNQPSVNL